MGPHLVPRGTDIPLEVVLEALRELKRDLSAAATEGSAIVPALAKLDVLTRKVHARVIAERLASSGIVLTGVNPQFL
jgi:hypothetical protein